MIALARITLMVVLAFLAFWNRDDAVTLLWLIPWAWAIAFLEHIPRFWHGNTSKNWDLRKLIPLFLLLIFLLGALVRISNIDWQIRSYDEMATWRFGGGETLPLLKNIAKQDCHPPLFYLIQQFSENTLGLNPTGIHYPTLLFSLLTLIFSYLFCRQFMGEFTALFPTMLLALSPLHVHLALYVRMYSLLIFFAAILFYLLPDALKGNLVKLRIMAMISTLVLFTHYMGVWLVVTLLVVLYFFGNALCRKQLRQNWLMLIFLPTLLFCLWLIPVLSQFSAISDLPLTYWLEHSNPAVVLDTLTILDWAENSSGLQFFFLLMLFPWSFFRRGKNYQDWQILHTLLWLPLLLNYINSLFFAMFLGAGIYQHTHVGYILLPALLLLTRMILLVPFRTIAGLLLLLFLLRFADISLQNSLAPASNPWKILLTEQVNQRQGVLAITPSVWWADLLTEKTSSRTLLLLEETELNFLFLQNEMRNNESLWLFAVTNSEVEHTHKTHEMQVIAEKFAATGMWQTLLLHMDDKSQRRGILLRVCKRESDNRLYLPIPQDLSTAMFKGALTLSTRSGELLKPQFTNEVAVFTPLSTEVEYYLNWPVLIPDFLPFSLIRKNWFVQSVLLFWFVGLILGKRKNRNGDCINLE